MDKKITVFNTNGSNVDIELVDQPLQVIWFNSNGEEINFKPGETPPCKIISSPKTTHRQYFIKTDQYGMFFSPLETYLHRVQWKYQSVNKDTFELYLRFLQTRQKVFLTNAQRKI